MNVAVNFRERMRTSTSNAEIDVKAELESRGFFPLSDQLFSILTFDPDEGLSEILYLPDGVFSELFYELDGDEVHKLKNMHKDEEKRELFSKRYGRPVLSFRYHAPLSHKKCLEICDSIEQKLVSYRKT